MQRHKKQANKNGIAAIVRSQGGIYADIQFRPNISIFPALSVSSPAINIKQDQRTQAATLRECHCTTSAMLQI